MKGPPPHPTALKVFRGNPGKRGLNRAEPQHDPLDATLPPELTDPIAQAEWTRVAGMLIDRGQVTIVDRAVLTGYCLKYAQWQALEKEAATHAFIVRSPNGYPLPNPALCMANKVFGLMLKAAAELGITPSSRSRVSGHPPREAVPISRWA